MVAFNLYCGDYEGVTPLSMSYTGWQCRWFNSLTPYWGKDEDIECPSGPLEDKHIVIYSQPYEWGFARLKVGHSPKDAEGNWTFGGGIPLNRIRHPTEVMAFGEARSYYAPPGPSWTGHKASYSGCFTYPASGAYDTMIPDRHLGIMNSAFVDGHVRGLKSYYLLTEWAKGTYGSQSRLFSDAN